MPLISTGEPPRGIRRADKESVIVSFSSVFKNNASTKFHWDFTKNFQYSVLISKHLAKCGCRKKANKIYKFTGQFFSGGGGRTTLVPQYSVSGQSGQLFTGQYNDVMNEGTEITSMYYLFRFCVRVKLFYQINSWDFAQARAWQSARRWCSLTTYPVMFYNICTLFPFSLEYLFSRGDGKEAERGNYFYNWKKSLDIYKKRRFRRPRLHC